MGLFKTIIKVIAVCAAIAAFSYVFAADFLGTLVLFVVVCSFVWLSATNELAAQILTSLGLCVIFYNLALWVSAQ